MLSPGSPSSYSSVSREFRPQVINSSSPIEPVSQSDIPSPPAAWWVRIRSFWNADGRPRREPSNSNPGNIQLTQHSSTDEDDRQESRTGLPGRQLQDWMEARLLSYEDSSVYYYKRDPSSRPSIYRVPPHVRGSNEDAYTPKIISIGPFHRQKQNGALNQMEPLKWGYLQDLIKRSRRNSLAGYIAAVGGNVQERARGQYSEQLELTSDELVEILVLDGCFILEFLFKLATESLGAPWGDARWNMPSLRHDLLLLENQIPFFVLQTLFDNTRRIPRPTNSPTPTLLHFALIFISKGKIRDVGVGSDKILHLLHLDHLCQIKFFTIHPNGDRSCSLVRSARRFVLWPIVACFFFLVSAVLMCKIRCPHRLDVERFPRAIPTARELREAGVRFKRKWQEKGKNCFLNVSFTEDGKLEMPLLSLENNSISNLRNLIAFEQCCLGDNPAQTRVTGRKKAGYRRPQVENLEDANKQRREDEINDKVEEQRLEDEIRDEAIQQHPEIREEAVDQHPEDDIREEAADQHPKDQIRDEAVDQHPEDKILEEAVDQHPEDEIGEASNDEWPYSGIQEEERRYFTAYAVLMDNIIDTAEDVAILQKSGIIESKLASDDDVARLFNGICSGAALDYDSHYLKEIVKRINQHCQSDRNRWRAQLVRRYFHSPWTVASILAALFVLLFTGTQTLYSLLSYYRKKN